MSKRAVFENENRYYPIFASWSTLISIDREDAIRLISVRRARRRLGVTRQSLIKLWLEDKLERTATAV
jgi:hypothetical protein